ncbi:hypothetical protein MKY91_20535 [Alkalicoccobacillus gibsonii]|uniref:Uncharacterized protein n=1 Tax=Alkalicoccobacillus gibsonii TaxID=79881 RepID=A0ABU9VNS8_9BACI
MTEQNVTQILKNKEIKMLIHDFYKNEYPHVVPIGVDPSLTDYEFIMFQLQKELSSKSKYDNLSEPEATLHLILSSDSSRQDTCMYSNHLLTEFKNMLKKIID